MFKVNQGLIHKVSHIFNPKAKQVRMLKLNQSIKTLAKIMESKTTVLKKWWIQMSTLTISIVHQIKLISNMFHMNIKNKTNDTFQ